MIYRKVVRVQMKREDKDGKVLYSNSEQINIDMPEAGFIDFEFYDGDKLIATTERAAWAGANPVAAISNFTITDLN